MNIEKLRFTGELAIKRFNGDTGELIETRLVKNLVVSSGITWVINRLVGTPSVMSHMAVGAGSTPASAGDTALGSEITRVALSSSNATDTSITYIGVFPAGVATGAITEAGILNGVTAGTLLARTVFPVLNKSADDVISITWTITPTASA